MIDDFLIEWGKDLSRFKEEEIEVPSRSVIQSAVHLASKLSKEGVIPPSRVVLDGEGGIAFELYEGSRHTSLELHKDGTIELVQFRGDRLTSRISM